MSSSDESPLFQTLLQEPGAYLMLRANLEAFFQTLNIDKCAEEAFRVACPAERARVIASHLRANGRSPGSNGHREQSKNQIRVLLTGCFDLMHAGHYNALRQAKQCFVDEGFDVVLVAGVHSDASIEAAKGAPTVWNHDERLIMARSCRWVDEVAGDLPYAVPVSLLDRLGCKWAVHGDDLPRVSPGVGLFDEVIGAGRLKIVKRTEGTSTTTLIGRIMSASKEHLQRPAEDDLCGPTLCGEIKGEEKVEPANVCPCMLLPTASRLAAWYGDKRRKLKDATCVVYAPGSWDLFHPGHVSFLEQAGALGDYLIAGCYSDEDVHRKKGRNFPTQTMYERALSLMSCRFCDDVVLMAPTVITQDLLTTLNISIVVAGTNLESESVSLDEGLNNGHDPFVVPRSLGMMRSVESRTEITADTIRHRVISRFLEYKKRQDAKLQSEHAYIETKSYVVES